VVRERHERLIDRHDILVEDAGGRLPLLSFT
jgi:hypothetical protein